MNLTPYDTDARLEPHPWQVQPRNLEKDPAEAARYGKVDFDNDASETVVTAYIERDEGHKGYNLNARGKGYTLHAYVHGDQDVSIKLTRDDPESPVHQESLLLQPSPRFQRKVQRTIDELPTEAERIGSEVYWQQGQALILVAGETGYRKQQAIIVYEPGYTSGDIMSAKVGNWASGVRDTRIG